MITKKDRGGQDYLLTPGKATPLPEPRLPPEVTVTIDGHSLTQAQVRSMRVAVSGMLGELADAKYCQTLGERLAQGYRDRLREVEALLVKR